MDFINKYKLKLILDNKTLLLCYILLMILNYIIISNIVKAFTFFITLAFF